jgi:signal transduction histidine kinase
MTRKDVTNMSKTELVQELKEVQAVQRRNEKENSADGVFILHRADEMARLIQDLLDVSSIEAGRLRLDKSTQALGPLLKLVLEDLQEQAEQKAIQLGSWLPTDNLDVDCDPVRIQQVLTNLIRNAIKFTKPGGSIQVRVEPLAGEACFSVTDTGVGIPNAALPHIFDRFTRVSKRSRQGSGLGLSIAKGIVEAHGGRIWVESHEGVGSTFSFTLPLMQLAPETQVPAEPVEERGQTQAVATSQSRDITALPVVLVVDDDIDSSERLESSSSKTATTWSYEQTGPKLSSICVTHHGALPASYWTS